MLRDRPLKHGMSVFIVLLFHAKGHTYYNTCIKSKFALQSWGVELDSNNSRISDFLEQLEKFVKNLTGARGNMTGHVSLADTEHGYMLDKMRSPADYQNAG